MENVNKLTFNSLTRYNIGETFILTINENKYNTKVVSCIQDDYSYAITIQLEKGYIKESDLNPLYAYSIGCE